MVDVVSCMPVPVGILPWPTSRTATLVTKLTFEIHGGAVALRAVQRPLSLEVRAPDGSVLEPNDFAPHKPLADVVVIGEEARVSHPPAYLALDSLRTSGTGLGAVASHDPRDYRWADGAFDFGRFQVAPPSQRLERIAFPARLSFARGNARLDIALDVRHPEMIVVDRAGRGGRTRVQLVCDTLLVDPRAGMVIGLFRGFAESKSGWANEMLIVDPYGERLEGIDLPAIDAWPRYPASTIGGLAPGSQTEPGSRDAEQTLGPGSVARGPVLPFRQAPPSAAGNESAARLAPRFGPPPAPPPSTPVQGAPPISARIPARAPSSPRAEEPAIAAAPAPRASVKLASAPRVAAPDHESVRSAPLRRSKLTGEEIGRIQAELEASPADRAAILTRHGLSELMWRLAGASD